jgi:hypothetical protein
MKEEKISLKWGTLKSWSLDESGSAFKILQEYTKLGTSMSAMAQRDSLEQKKLICNLIDAANCQTIYNSWTGNDMTKEEAKHYVLTY